MIIQPPESFWPTFRKTNGALSACESIAIMAFASLAPEGVYAEYGSFKGKSAMSALVGLKEGKFILVDPEFKDREWVKETAAAIDEATGKKNHLEFLPDYSTNVIEKHDKYAYVFVDSGSHQDGLPMKEARMLEDRMVSGGIIGWHDLNSQFQEVREAYDYLLGTGKYDECHIDWVKVINYAEEHNLEDGTNQTWHHTELKHPCFVGALRRK
jgi:hypothetical protein